VARTETAKALAHLPPNANLPVRFGPNDHVRAVIFADEARALATQLGESDAAATGALAWLASLAAENPEVLSPAEARTVINQVARMDPRPTDGLRELGAVLAAEFGNP
jgi:hypothetical protein